MNNFAKYLTPEEAKAVDDKFADGRHKTLSWWQKLAGNNKRCDNCGEHVWRYGGVDLCFTCTTGEADASDDYEVGEPYN